MFNLKTYCANTPDAVSKVIENINQIGIRLVMFFSSTKYRFDTVSKAFRTAFPDIDVVGCTTSGEISNYSMTHEGTIVAFSIAADENDFNTSVCVIRDIKFRLLLAKNNILSAAKKVGIEPGKYNNSFAITLIDGLQESEEKVMMVLKNALDGLPIIGGSAGDDLAFKETLISANGEIYTDAAVVTFVNTNIKTFLYKENIYAPTNIEFKVTKADPWKRLVMELNGMPAAEVYARALRIPVGLLEDYFMKYPLGRVFNNDIWISSPKEVIDGKHIAFYTLIMTNSTVKLLKPISSLDTAKKTVDIIKERLPGVKSVIMFNCVLRHLQFKNENSSKAIANEFSKIGNVCGFSTYGEQFGKYHINQTLALMAFGE